MNPARFMAGVKAAENHPVVEYRICERDVWKNGTAPVTVATFWRRERNLVKSRAAWLQRGGFR